MSSAVEINEPRKALAALELFSTCASLTDEHSCYPYFHSFFCGKSVHRFIGLLVSVGVYVHVHVCYIFAVDVHATCLGGSTTFLHAM